MFITVTAFSINTGKAVSTFIRLYVGGPYFSVIACVSDSIGDSVLSVYPYGECKRSPASSSTIIRELIYLDSVLLYALIDNTLRAPVPLIYQWPILFPHKSLPLISSHTPIIAFFAGNCKLAIFKRKTYNEDMQNLIGFPIINRETWPKYSGL